MQECIHFDGEECRNGESNYYGSYGDNCVNCENKEVDNMKEKIKIVDCYGTDADGFETYVAQAYELNLELIIAYKDINKPHINVDIKNAERVDRYLQSLGYYSEALYVDMNVLQGCDVYTIDIYFEEKGRKWLKDMILNYINSTKEVEAIQQQVKFIKNVIEEINKISKEVDDEIWDAGLIDTTFEVYTILEKECQRIANELNIDFDMNEYTPTEGVPKAIELIEKEIL